MLSVAALRSRDAFAPFAGWRQTQRQQLIAFCATHHLHPYDGVRRTHVEVYLRQLEQQAPLLANATLRRRVSTSRPRSRWTRGPSKPSTRRLTDAATDRCC